MSRTVVIALVAIIIAALTGGTYVAVDSMLRERTRKEAQLSVARGRELLRRTAQLEALSVFNKAERLAASPELLRALKSESNSERGAQAGRAFTSFNAKENGTRPDIMALLDATGNVVAMADVTNVVAKQWKDGKGEIVWPAIRQALARRIIISEIWDYPDLGMMKVGIAPIIDPDAQVTSPDPDSAVVIVGAVVVAYAQTSADAQSQADLMGVQLAYLDNGKASATSFRRGADDKAENTQRQSQVAAAVKANASLTAQNKEPVQITLGDVTYFAANVQMPRQASKRLPDDYPAMTASALVMAPITDASGLGEIRLYVLVLGIAAMALGLLGMYLIYRRLIAQIDPIELGVADIINGNLDRTFRPVGQELDGLANGLNVMMARLLGRPEPGEEAFDEDGNPIVPGKVEFEEAEQNAAPKTDPELAALAQESEPDYYKRIYTEYLAARKASGHPDEVSFENFIAKLKVNEGKLKAQYQCRAVRFRVVTKDGKVSLKPVPIFA